jgi:hypothetical protein
MITVAGLCFQKREDLGLGAQVELGAGGGERFEAEGIGSADEGGANHAAVAGDEGFGHKY